MNPINKNKSLSMIVIAILIASITLTAVTIAPAKAQTGISIGTPSVPTTGGPVPNGVTPSQSIPTIAYMSFSPNPIGVGQSLLVNIWTQPAVQVNRGRTGYSVIITKPDGTAETVGPMVSFQGDTTAYFSYIPDTPGNYTLQFFYAGDYYPAGYYFQGQLTNTSQINNIVVSAGTTANAGFNATTDCYYMPSQTTTLPLVVQQSPVQSWQPSTLPGAGQYWTRPISPDNREWWLIGGNDPNNEVGGGTGTPGWPDNTNTYTSPTTSYEFVPYTTGPTSAHIVWRMQDQAIDGIFGGLIDGAYTPYQAPDQDASGAAFTFGQSGPGFGGNPNIVWNGRCYEVIAESYQGLVQPVWTCFDLQTGKVYFQITGINNGGTNQAPTMISYSENTMPVPGGAARTDRTVASLLYLGSGRVIKYNPITGAVILNQTIPTFSSSTLYADPNVLSVQTINATLNQYRLINWTITGLGSNFTTNIISNITWPFASLGSADYESMITVTTQSLVSGNTGISDNVWVEAASLTTGQLLWNVSSGVGYQVYSGMTGLSDHGMYSQRFDNGYWYTWNLHTGQLLWKSAISSVPWGTFGSYGQANAYGDIFYGQYDGVVAINWTTGKVDWHFMAPSLPFETPYLTNGTGNPNGSTQGYSFFSQDIVAGGIVYDYSVEHSPSAPLTRGWSIYAINATTGDLLWSTTGPMIPGVVSDGYLTATNYYDGYMYVFGMGQSATTVTAPLDQIIPGQTVTITGSVTDKSPMTTQTAEYAPGTAVPCVSHDSMGAFMAYLFQQAPCPTNLTGVPVSIDAVDPNGNHVHIASVTSDGTTGQFGCHWTPTIAGQYTIYATYAGDDSYGYSTAATYATITSQTTTATPTTTAAPSNLATTADIMTYIIVGVIAIIIAIAIVGALILRKK